MNTPLDMHPDASTLDATHDPLLRSWVASANEAGCDFPIQNLPLAIFRRRGSQEAFRGGVAIGRVTFRRVASRAVIRGHVSRRRRSARYPR